MKFRDKNSVLDVRVYAYSYSRYYETKGWVEPGTNQSLWWTDKYAGCLVKQHDAYLSFPSPKAGESQFSAFYAAQALSAMQGTRVTTDNNNVATTRRTLAPGFLPYQESYNNYPVGRLPARARDILGHHVFIGTAQNVFGNPSKGGGGKVFTYPSSGKAADRQVATRYTVTTKL